MRVFKRMRVCVYGYGVGMGHGVPKRFDGEECQIDWVDDETDDQFIQVVPSDGGRYIVHACQCVPVR